MTRQVRPTRTPINGAKSRLGVKGKEPGFQYRIVNDTPGRIQEFIDAGYEIVQDTSVSVGDKRIANPTQEGTPVKVHVGNGNNAYLLRIKEDWYKEDQASKQIIVDELERGTKQRAKEEKFYGELKLD